MNFNSISLKGVGGGLCLIGIKEHFSKRKRYQN